MSDAKRQAGSLELVGGRLCLDFVNTATARGRPEHRDYLSSFEAMLAWGRHAGAIKASQMRILDQTASTAPKFAAEALDFSIQLRESIYRLLQSACLGGRPAACDLSVLNSALREAGSRRAVHRGTRGLEWVWEFDPQDLRSLLWPVVFSAAELLTSPEAARLRQCAREGCQWMFLDLSKNRSRRWCSMGLCGSRVKAHRFYHRTRQKAARNSALDRRS
jgi:predicted RNA-binding Zn ribbon-like protein